MGYMGNKLAIIVPGVPGKERERLMDKAIEEYGSSVDLGWRPYLVVSDWQQHGFMSNYLKGNGMPSEYLIEEKEARYTEENVKNTVDLCGNLGFDSMRFVFPYYHAKRFVGEIRKGVPEEMHVSWTYREPDFGNLENDVFMLSRFVTELGSGLLRYLDKGEHSAFLGAMQKLLEKTLGRAGFL